MEITIWRKYRKPDYTIGRLYVDGKFFCNTLEDTDRGLAQFMSVGEIMTAKVKGATAIPIGDYKVTRTWSPRFGRLVPQIMNVKGFSGVRLHAGNTAKDTEGCPLLGDNTAVGRLTNSQKRMKAFDALLQTEGGSCDLHIVWEYNEK